ncbi:MAG: hypothetical protein E7191_05495 [Erysipelotrichaceae bacterium]|nr:hypothetical protein [Erysipelotrichaceae bacterium]
MSLKELLQQHEIKRFVILCSLITIVVLFVQIAIELQFTLLEVVLLLTVGVLLFEKQVDRILSVIREVL